jgi:hypothetical protein
MTGREYYNIQRLKARGQIKSKNEQNGNRLTACTMEDEHGDSSSSDSDSDSSPSSSSSSALSSTSSSSIVSSSNNPALKKNAQVEEEVSQILLKYSTAKQAPSSDEESRNLLEYSSDEQPDKEENPSEGQDQKQTKTSTVSKKRMRPIEDILGNACLTVDWARLAQTKWGDENLWQNLEASEVSTLVGLATTYSDGQSNNNLHDDVLEFEDLRTKAQIPAETNPLVGLDSSPWPPSYLNSLIRMSFEVSSFDHTRLDQAFDDSALVAIGMILEEMITASMLPLAGLHVRRCRELEGTTETVNLDNHSGQKSATTDTVDSFHEWTLPPEEAVMKLLLHPNRCSAHARDAEQKKVADSQSLINLEFLRRLLSNKL